MRINNKTNLQGKGRVGSEAPGRAVSDAPVCHRPGPQAQDDAWDFICEENAHCCDEIKCILILACYAYLSVQSEKKVVLIILTLITFSISCW